MSFYSVIFPSAQTFPCQHSGQPPQANPFTASACIQHEADFSLAFQLFTHLQEDAHKECFPNSSCKYTCLLCISLQKFASSDIFAALCSCCRFAAIDKRAPQSCSAMAITRFKRKDSPSPSFYIKEKKSLNRSSAAHKYYSCHWHQENGSSE